MEITPIEHFNKWFEEELNLTKVRIPAACCLSTFGIDNFPNARFVALKGVLGHNFIVTGPLNSRKGIEINTANKVALTFWWTETERQVRIQGHAVKITEELADKYFSERSRGSQIVSIVSEQGSEIKDLERLNKKYETINLVEESLTRPEDWGGYSIVPIRIEFLEFQPTRFHNRKLYELSNGKWTVKQIQP